MKVLIAGCGYVGIPLGAELSRKGHDVFACNRTNALQAQIEKEGIHFLAADVSNRSSLDKLPAPFDWVVDMVSAGGGGPAEYRQTYLQGATNLIDWLKSTPLRKFVYTSSTAVYGQDDGSQVKEESPTEPASETARILVETERALMEAFQTFKFPAAVLRVAGIYGPDRGYWLHQFLRNQAVIEGNGDRWVNMIQRDDLVQIIIAALQSARAGQFFNVVDDEPVSQLHLFRWLSETIGKPMPPFVPLSRTGAQVRNATHKRVLNRKLKMELGIELKFPTFRQGMTAEIQRMEAIGAVDLA
jgi:nucleoside-diphosphate-sugar epimerase